VAISDAEIRAVVAAYLTQHPDEEEVLAEPRRQLSNGAGFASRHTFPMHVTVGALLVRGDEVLLVEHRAYGGILLQPGGHLEPDDVTLPDAALRELVEEADVDHSQISLASDTPVYIEYGAVPARPAKDEPAHYHLDIGYSFFASERVEVGCIQEVEVTGADWYPLAAAERRVGRRIGRAVKGAAGIG
jgi:8-oxo-dGTP pyrophosphatase MutT (NUDIX family)